MKIENPITPHLTIVYGLCYSCTVLRTQYDRLSQQQLNLYRFEAS